MYVKTARGRSFILIFIPILLALSCASAKSDTKALTGASGSASCRRYALIAEGVTGDRNASYGEGEPPTANKSAAPAARNGQDQLKNLQIRVQGSLCPACLKQLQRKLSAMEGITNVTVKAYALEHYGQDDKRLSTEEKKSATYTLTFNPEKISQERIEEQFKSNDFRIAEIKTIE